MRKSIFAFATFALILTSNLVSAATIFGENSVLGPIMKYVFGITGAMPGNEMAVMFAVWVIFFVAASDIISIFTMFNTAIAWFIGFALAIIMANTTATYAIAKSMFGLAATMGAIGIALILIGGFLAAMLFHFGSNWAASWLMRARMARRAALGTEDIREGFAAAATVGREARRAPVGG